jgi:hypothetical protein
VFAENEIGDDGARAIAGALDKNSSLQKIFLSGECLQVTVYVCVLLSLTCECLSVF